MKIGNTAKKIVSLLLALMVIMAQVPVSFATDTDVDPIVDPIVDVDKAVTWNLTNITAPGIATVPANQGLSATLVADSGFILPQTVSVSIAGVDAGSYALANGLLSIPAEQITGDLIITASALPASYAVTWTLEHITASAKPDTVQTDQGLTVTLTAEEGYSLPETITVTGAANYTYSPSDGQLTIPAYQNTSAVSIEAAATEKPCTITWDIPGIVVTPAPKSIAKNETLNVQIWPGPGFELPDSVKAEGPVTVNTYDKENHILDFTATDFGKEIKISAAGIPIKYEVKAAADSVDYVTITSENPAPYQSTVTFTVSRTDYVDNYGISEVTARTVGGDSVTVQESGNGYSFVMPADAVEISVTWELTEAGFELHSAAGRVEPNKKGWYAVSEGDVIPLAPATKVSDSTSGPLSDSLHVTETKKFYVSDGVSFVEKEVKLDATKPTGKAKIGNNELSHDYKNGLKSDSAIVIEGSDTGSGVDTIEYAFMSEEEFNSIVSDGSLSQSLSEAEVNGINGMIGEKGWTSYSGSVELTGLSAWTRYALVIQVTDVAGNKGISCYGVVYCSRDSSLSIGVTEGSFKVNEKDGVYHIKDTGKNDDKVVLSVDYSGSSQAYPPQLPKITVKRDNKELAPGADYAVSPSWKWTGSGFSCYVELYIDSKAGTPLADGTYQVSAEVKDHFSLFDRNTAVSPEMRLSRKTPALEFSYQGYTGYDEGNTYNTAAASPDEIPAEVSETTFTSNKIFYINKEKSLTIHFRETNGEIIEPWSLSASIDGAAVEVKPENGFAVDVNNKSVVIDGDKAEEGKYTLTFAVPAFNECVSTINVTVVVDHTGPKAEISAIGFTRDAENNIVPGNGVENGVWTNEKNIQLTLSNVTDIGGLLENCVAASLGITGKTTIENGSWTGTIEAKEQNHKYTVTLTDKAGNSSTKEFTLKVDTTAAKEITVMARKDTTDMALIADQFTFGVFHVDYDRLSVAVEDPQPDNPGEYDKEAEKTSEISSVEYYFLTSNDGAYKELFSYLDSNGKKQYYNQADVKSDTKAQNVVTGNIETFMDGIMNQAQNEGVWETCGRDAIPNPNKVVTGQINKNLQYIAFFRVWDNAGNMNCFYRSVVITDDTAPEVTFAIDEKAAKVELEDGSVIYTGAVPVTVTVTEPHSDTNAYSGINKVIYTVLRGDDEVFASEKLTGLDIAEEGESTPSADDPLHPQGANQVSKVITLDDLDGQVIDAKNIYIKVEVQDISGNSTVYTSDAQLGLINIDKAAPEVKVDFDGTPLNGKYYGVDRTATITIEDNNFDPATGVTLDTTGELGEWTEAEVDAYGKVSYTAKVVFADGEHNFAITETKDKAEHKIEDDKVTYNVEDQKDFIVDTVDPMAAISFARVDGEAFSDYNNADVVMTIVVAEKNFSANGVSLTVTRDGGAFGVNLGWNHNGDTHTATYTFDPEGTYIIDLSVTDLAGHTDKVDTEQFVLDKTAPEIEILNVEDQHAYNAETVIPVIRVTDTNYSDFGVTITITGVHGGTAFYDEANIGGGQQFTFENIEDDDLYMLRVRAVDEAKNESEMLVKFSVNRNGSVFTGDEEIAKAMENGMPYFRTDTLPPVRVIETNVDIIESAKIYLTKDNSNIDLVEGRDYTITRKDVNGGWSQYAYELNEDLFLEDGVYRVSLVTRDAAGNAKNAESIVAFIVDNTLPVLLVTDLESGTIYNEELKHVVFTPNDNLVLSKIQVILNGAEIAVWEGKELAEMIRSGAEFGFDIPEGNSLQDVQLILTDAAGNENENQLIENFLVSTNLFVRFYNNKPVFYGTIAGVIVLGGCLWLILARRKKEKEKETVN